jgi:diguanylate cyclase (GGDEF)-like protein
MAKQQILVASDDPRIREMARDAAQAEGLDAILCGDGEEALDSARKASPGTLRLIVTEAFLPKADGFKIVGELQEEPASRGVPVLMLIAKKDGTPASPAGGVNRPRLGGDNYLQKPFEPSELRAEIHSMNKHYRAHGAPHPVTGLPGHPLIEQEVFNRLNRGESFSMLWMDINHFRPYNDHFGTGKGDEVLKFFPGLVAKVKASLKLAAGDLSFVAQVGGDDFVLFAPEGRAEEILQELRGRFDEEIVSFYGKDHVKQGFYRGKGRDNAEQVFPLMTLSMAVQPVRLEDFVHYGQLVSHSNELLRQAKIGS